MNKIDGSVVFKPVRPDATFFANPLDTFNGHPLSKFCGPCKVAILEIGRTDRRSADLCVACSEMVARGAE